MGKFKIGDVIVATKDAICHGNARTIKKGEQVVVYKMGFDSRFIWFEETGTGNGHYQDGDFELYKEKPKNKLNVGDKVIGNDAYHYAITNSRWFGTIVEMLSYGQMIVEGVYKDNPKYRFTVEEKYFDLYNKTNNMSKKLTGYQLKKAIPGDSRAVGTVVSTEKSDYYELLADFWTPIYKEVEDEVVIASYKAKFYKGYVEFGCQTFTKVELLAIKRLWYIDNSVAFKLGETPINANLLDKILSKI